MTKTRCTSASELGMRNLALFSSTVCNLHPIMSIPPPASPALDLVCLTHPPTPPHSRSLLKESFSVVWKQ